ncbi:hypothetical protein KCU88_g208, partial [Aureobasidium melanogenum]
MERAAKGRKEEYRSLVIGTGIGEVLSPSKASVIMSAVFHGWRSEDRNVKCSWVSVDGQLLAPHGEETLPPAIGHVFGSQ